MSSHSNGHIDDIVVNVDDVERLAHQKLPLVTKSFYQDGADHQQTVAENLQAYRRLRLLPRVLRDVSNIDTKLTLLGKPVSMPVGISPTALQKMAHPLGELGTAKAAARAGTVMILSALSSTSMEDVAATAPCGLRWLQLEVVKDRSVTESFVSRAERLGYTAIVLTIDIPVFGQRLSSIKNGFTCPEHIDLANYEGTNYAYLNKKKNNCLELLRQQFDRSLTWDILPWLRSITRLPVVVKGILTAQDAEEAVNYGASAIVVSNHGGRQLDTVPATIEVLPGIVKAVRGSCEVYIDGGVRTGTDVVKALALGARAVFVGRPILWGLAYDGTNGVSKVLSIFKNELERALALMGCASLKDIKPSMVTHQDSLRQPQPMDRQPQQNGHHACYPEDSQ
ncbi:uncharacterized protein LOC144161472 [Haemaphysalis longicornis]